MSNKLLSPKQVRMAIIEALKTRKHLTAQARARGEDFDDSEAAFAEWRHAQVRIATDGRAAGLTSATNDDFRAIIAQFQSARGEDGQAFKSHLAAATEQRRQNEFVLVREMERGGFGPAYVEKICRSAFKCTVADATPDVLLKLTFTLVNRGRAKARRLTDSTI